MTLELKRTVQIPRQPIPGCRGVGLALDVLAEGPPRVRWNTVSRVMTWTGFLIRQRN